MQKPVTTYFVTGIVVVLNNPLLFTTENTSVLTFRFAIPFAPRFKA